MDNSQQNNVTPNNIPSGGKDDEAYNHVMQVCSSFIVTPVVIAATQLDLFEIIAKEGSGSSSDGADSGLLSASEIASRLPTQNPNAPSMLDQMLRLLATHSLLTCSSRTLEDGKVEILYGLAPAGKFLVKDADGISLTSLVQLRSYRAFMDMCYNIKDAVLDGGVPFCKAQNMSLFEYLGKNHSVGQAFDKAMSDNSTIVMKRILQTYKGFEGLTSLVDVGGGIGTCLNMINSKYPSIAGINFDLPRVIEKAPSYDNGIKHVGGDMFARIPKADAILLKLVCHNWSDEKCLIILKNCYLALPDDGKVIVIESILSRTPETSSLARYISQFDNIMSAYFGARERTQVEFEALAKGAGFSYIQIQCQVYSKCVIELYK